jgi:long-subunit fatty acid transport protein
MKKLIFTVILLPFLGSSHAQDFVDNALLFSRIQPGGSARIQALGGAQVSLGGDYSSALSNPAGLGMFNRSEITFSLGLNDNTTSSTYFGNTSDDGRTVLTIPGFSYVQKHERAKEKYLGGAFGFSYSRTNNFNAQYSYQGDNNESSIIDYFITDAVDQLSEFTSLDYYSLTGLAFEGYLIDEFKDDNGNPIISTRVYPDTLVFGPLVNFQNEFSTRKGSQSQLSLSYGGNYNDELFFGASIGIASINFRQSLVYQESDFEFQQDPSYNALRYLTTNENYDIQGSGVNITFGTIYRPVDFIQIGLSYLSPTFYNVTDTYTASVEAQWNNFDDDDNPSTPSLKNQLWEFDVPLISEYGLRTPGKFTVGTTFISKYGFISGDFEFVDYSKAKYSSNITGIPFDRDNSLIKSNHRNVMNYRIGTEFRYELFRFRAGYNYQADPYREQNDIDRSVQTISGGAGMRMTNFYIDFTVLQAKSDSRRIPYFADGLPTPVASQKNTTTNFMVTVGFPF